MKQNYVICIFLLCKLGFWAKQVGCRGLPMESNSMMQRHKEWMAQHGRTYKDLKENEKRLQIFKKNVEYIEDFNKNGNNTKYKLKINRFADLDDDEFRALRQGFRHRSFNDVFHHKRGRRNFRYGDVKDVPDSMDWREKGAVTPVKNQGLCSSCWAFSAVAAIEGLTKITTGNLISLSEQELIDCDTNGNNHGCHFGHMDKAFEFVTQNHGLTTELNYPYNGAQNQCNTQKTSSHVANIGGYEYVPPNDENSLLKAVAHQPVSVAIDTKGDGFRFYSSGVFSGKCGTDLDHGVILVGYGSTEDGIKYWLVKNSWGTSWGEKGYVRIERDVDAKEGMCGIAKLGSYPVA